MNLSDFLRHFGAAATLIAIRSAVGEPPAPRSTRAQHDPWYGSDPTHATAWAGAPVVVTW